MKTAETPALSLELARKVLAVVDCGLVQGAGVPEPGRMCVEAAVCYAYGLPHGDNPPCVGEAVRSFKIGLNDSPSWPSAQARALGLRALAIAQLGSVAIDQGEFARIVSLQTIRQILPIALLGRAEGRHGKKTLREAASRCAVASAADAADAAVRAADAATACGAAYAVVAAGWAVRAVYAARATYTIVAAYAATAAAHAVDAAVRAAHAVAHKTLLLSASIALEALKELKSPGCQYLHLLEGAPS